MTTAIEAAPPRAPVFTITRDLEAPPEQVFRAFTARDELIRWWGPRGFDVHACTLDLRPGGSCHYGLRSADGQKIWGKLTWREITPPERLVFIVTFSDPEGGLARHPWNPEWPLQVLSTVTFTARGGGTRLTVEWVPHAANETERRAFAEGQDSMHQGWTGTLDRLEAHLSHA